MKNLITFEECCEYLGISTELPVCQVDERQIQAVYKLRVCMRAWNKQDGFEPDETGGWDDKNVGYTPLFFFKDDKLLFSCYAISGSNSGLVSTTASYAAAYTSECFGLRLPLSSRERAIDFGKVFIEIFNELI